MIRETRQLAVYYLIFALFLALTAGEPGAGARQASAPRLRRVSPVPPSANKIAPDSVLRGLGFLPAQTAESPWRIFPQSAAVPQGWRLSSPAGRARETLSRAVQALAGGDGPDRWRESRWSLEGGLLRVWLAPASGSGSPLRLEAPVANPLAVVPRDDAIPPRLPDRRPVPPAAPRRPAGNVRPSHRVPRVAIIVDDVGTVPGTERFLALPAPLTFAVLPFTPHAGEFLRRAAAAGRPVILHLPLEALDGGVDPGPGVIPTSAAPEQILAQLEADLQAVPGAIGVNNHMGSRGTSDGPLMATILAALQERGLFFVDSKTWHGSVAGDTARAIGLRHAARDIFLDPEGASVEEIRRLLRELITMARTRGAAIGICHANRPHTLAALVAAMPDFAAAGVEIVSVAELVHE